jgi:hypothetical protein
MEFLHVFENGLCFLKPLKPTTKNRVTEPEPNHFGVAGA